MCDLLQCASVLKLFDSKIDIIFFTSTSVMTKIYAGLGSNLGNERENIVRAIDRIDAHEGICIKEKSGLYNTAPVGGPQMPTRESVSKRNPVFIIPLLLVVHHSQIMLIVS